MHVTRTLLRTLAGGAANAVGFLAILLALTACDGSSPLTSGPQQGLSASTSSSVASTALASATGSGNTIVAGELRTFSFVAQLNEDGAARGKAQINNRMVNEMFQLDIDCLRVFGNVAVMSGIITRHTDVTAVGLTGIFGVIDTGEGTGAPPDAVTQVFFFRPGTATCQDVTPDLVVAAASPIVSGNVQVH